MNPFSQKFASSWLWLCLISLCLTVCACSGFIGAKNNQAQAQYEAAIQKQSAQDPARPVISKNDGAYLAGEKISVAEQLSPLLKKKVVYKPSKSVMLPDVAHWISEEFSFAVDLTGLQVNTSNLAGQGVGTAVGTPAMTANGAITGVNGQITGAMPAPLGSPAALMAPNAMAQYPIGANYLQSMARLPLQIPLNLNYEGTLNGLLDQLAQKTGVWWKFADGKAIFYRSESKTFYLPSIARKFAGKSTITTNTSSSTAASGSSTSTSSGTTSSSGSDSTATYDVDLWTDIAATAKVVGKDADVAVNAAAGSITVTGSPAQVRHVESWVKTLSDQLSQQIKIEIDIYTVAVNNEENYSWNPNVIFKSAGNLGFNITGASAPTVIGAATPLNIGSSVINSASNYSGTTAAVNALSTIGKVSQRFHQEALAMNGQPTPIQDADQRSYIYSSGVTTTANVGSTTTITPGSFTVGFTGMFVPRIINGKIVLGMTMTNSVLNSLKTMASGSGVNQSSIQVPDIGTTTIQNTVTLSSGDALLLTSLANDSGSNQNNGILSPFFYLFGGGFDSSSSKKIVAIIVTAKVL